MLLYAEQNGARHTVQGAREKSLPGLERGKKHGSKG